MLNKSLLFSIRLLFGFIKMMPLAADCSVIVYTVKALCWNMSFRGCYAHTFVNNTEVGNVEKNLPEVKFRPSAG